ncbi:MAG: hypothetical protein VB957_16615 [Pseudomonadales bacterium]
MKLYIFFLIVLVLCPFAQGDNDNHLVLGSFSEKSGALAELERISEQLSVNLHVMTVIINGTEFHRLLMGPIYEQDESFYKTLAANAGISNPWMTRNVIAELAETKTKTKTMEVRRGSTRSSTPSSIIVPVLASDDGFNLAKINHSGPPFSTVDDERQSNFSGYAKSFAVAQDKISTDFFEIPQTYQSQNSIRIMWEQSKGIRGIQIHYELSPVFLSRQQAVESATFSIVGDTYRLTDIQSSLSDEDDKTQLYQNLDRLNVQWRFDHGDLTIGRQAITFGSARMINPTDIFLPFNVQTFNQEYRAGVDAIRYQTPFGDLGEIDIGIVLGEDAKPENSAAFLQLKANVDGKDLQLAITQFAEQTLVGVGIQTALGDFGFWFEIADVSGDLDYLRASIGLDYAFTENIFGMVEYHYNGAGSDDPAEYLALFNILPYQRGGVFLLGQEYLMPSLSFQLSPLWNFGIQSIINLSDQSAFVSISAEYYLAENFYMDFGYYHFEGDELTTLVPGIPRFQSEYGTNPDVLYASIRFYF